MRSVNHADLAGESSLQPGRMYGMRLKSARVQMFRNVVDSGTVEFQPDVTCLVGKNESGKTALLTALHRTHPAPNASKFDALADYPRWRYTKDRKDDAISDVEPVTCWFEMEDADVDAVEAVFGRGVVEPGKPLRRVVRYDNTVRFGSEWWNETKAMANVLDAAGGSAGLRKSVAQADTLKDVADACDELASQPENELAEEARDLLAKIEELLDGQTGVQAAYRILSDRLPKFFYFSNYQILPGRIDLQELGNTSEDDPAQTPLQAARALLKLVGADTENLTAEDLEARKAEIEAVNNDLTDQVFTYWTQNEGLEVSLEVDKVTVPATTGYGGETAVARYLDVRVRDSRHGFTGNFGQRSSGFQWFFSFLAAFSEFEAHEHGVIVLLDEPALNLHGRAQADFLRFINDRLAAKSQVIYTTHSPFMVEPSRLERVRIVEDKAAREGAKVTQDVYTVGAESLFPLQAALGYDIAQNLFIGPDNLLLEGTSDATYLRVMSEHLASRGREQLSERWRIIQSGGATNMPTFVSLLGDKLDVTLLIDGTSKSLQKIENLVKGKAIDKNRLLVTDTYTGMQHSDMEDMFTPAEYLKMYNKAFGTSHKVKDLIGKDRIIDRIGRAEGLPFTKHGKPADILLRDPGRATFLASMSPGTLDKFESLFGAINQTLSA